MAALPDSTGKLTGKAREIYDEILARRSAQGAKVRGLYIPLMNHPELTQLIEHLGYYLKFEGKLPRDAYQFIVLSIARRIEVPFEWLDHVASARAAGLSDALIEAILKSDRGSIPHPVLSNSRNNRCRAGIQVHSGESSESNDRTLWSPRSLGSRDLVWILPNGRRDNPGI